MLFNRLAHVCLNVKDLQRSLDYYHKLGFTDCFKFTRKGDDFGMYLKVADETFIEVFQDAAMGGPAQNKGLAHFCLETVDMEAVMAELSAKGVAFTPKKRGSDGTWQIWLEDPDGNKFEVHEYTKESKQHLGGVVEATW
jgi:lactoylglutathione lyase/glyoxylase I family protein